MGERREVRPLTEANQGEFLAFMADEASRGWCFCVAWWVDTWKGFPERSAAENRRLRESLLARGERDGYLLYVDDRVAGWCQAGPRDRLPTLASAYGLAPDPSAWAITCFEIDPARRGGGAARDLLSGVLHDLRRRGVRRVEGFPKRGDSLEPGEAWNGPERLFSSLGFREESAVPRGPVMVIEWAGGDANSHATFRE